MQPKPRSPSLPPTLLWSLRGPTLQTRPQCPAQNRLHLTRQPASEGNLPTESGPPLPTNRPGSRRSLTHRRSYSWTPRVLLGSDVRPWADPEAIPFLEPSPQPSEQESSFILQCLWSRSIIAVIAALPAVAPNKEIAISIMQAIKASAAIAILTVPRDHGFLQSPELAACLHDSAFHMCPSPRRGEVILASTRLPTWPCPDSELLALEALCRMSKLPLRLGNLTELSYAPLLKTSGPFVAHRRPYAMAPEHPARRTTAYPITRVSARPLTLGYNGHRSPTYHKESSHTSAKADRSIPYHKKSSQRR